MNFQATERLIRDTFELASNQVTREAKTAFATTIDSEGRFLGVETVKDVLVPLLGRNVSTIVNLVDDEEVDRVRDRPHMDQMRRRAESMTLLGS